MRLVIDTNIILAALLKPSTTQKLIFSEKLTLLSPEYALEEIYEHIEELEKRSGKNKRELELAIQLIFSEIEIITCENYSVFKEKALNEIKDKDDWPFLALAFLKKCPIWSNDKALKQQSLVKVFSTAEIYGFIKGEPK